jgi:hypothetical protein
LPRLPSLLVEDVLLQECEERFHRRVVAGGTDAPIDPLRPAALSAWTKRRDRNRDPRPECSVVPAGFRSAIALRRAVTARSAVILESIE